MKVFLMMQKAQTIVTNQKTMMMILFRHYWLKPHSGVMMFKPIMKSIILRCINDMLFVMVSFLSPNMISRSMITSNAQSHTKWKMTNLKTETDQTTETNPIF